MALGSCSAESAVNNRSKRGERRRRAKSFNEQLMDKLQENESRVASRLANVELQLSYLLSWTPSAPVDMWCYFEDLNGSFSGCYEPCSEPIPSHAQSGHAEMSVEALTPDQIHRNPSHDYDRPGKIVDISSQSSNQDIAGICETLDVLQKSLSEQLYTGSPLGERVQFLTDATELADPVSEFSPDERVEVDEYDLGRDIDCNLEESKTCLAHKLDKLQEVSNFLSVNASFFRSVDEASDVVSCFFHLGNTNDNEGQTHTVEKLFGECLECPASLLEGSLSKTSVVVCFEGDQDEEDRISGWSPFIVAWPSGRCAEMTLPSSAGLSAPKVDQYDITIKVSHYLFEDLCLDSEANLDPDDLSIIGDMHGIFKVYENLVKIVKLSITTEG